MTSSLLGVQLIHNAELNTNEPRNPVQNTGKKTKYKTKVNHDAFQNTHIVRSIFRAHLILRPDYFVGARCDFQIRLVRMY